MYKFEFWLTEDGLLQLEAWARDGLSREQLAKNCGVSTRTLRRWERAHPEIKASLRRGRAVADIVIENALYKKAQGYFYKDEAAFKVKEVIYDPQTGKKVNEVERIETAEIQKYAQPDTSAQVFWLKNRKPNEWRDKKELAHDAAITFSFGARELTPEEQEEIMG